MLITISKSSPDIDSRRFDRSEEEMEFYFLIRSRWPGAICLATHANWETIVFCHFFLGQAPIILIGYATGFVHGPPIKRDKNYANKWKEWLFNWLRTRCLESSNMISEISFILFEPLVSFILLCTRGRRNVCHTLFLVRSPATEPVT